MSKKPTSLHLLHPNTVLKESPRVSRNDGWKNLVTLLGTSADKRTASHLNWEHRDPEFYEQLYAGGGIPARIVDLVPDEAMREWVDWANVENEDKERIADRCEELDARGGMLKAWKWGRAFGGGCLHIVTNTKDPASPLQRGEKVIGLRDLSRWDLRILTTDIEYDFGSTNFGHPRIYYLNLQMGAQYKGYPIHWTRMIRFDGQLVPRRTFIRNNYWHDSILNRLYDTIRDYQTSNDAAAACLQDFNVDVYTMKGLANMVAAGKEQIIKNRIETMNYAKSVLNGMIIDADEEGYENKGRSLEGVADLLKHQANRLVAETDIPHTKLLGESPDGSNSTGNSTSQQWYNFISSEQTNYFKPKLKRLASILFYEQPKLSFTFRSLRKLDELETAELRNKQSVTDKNYIDAQVLDPSEVTKSRFGGEEYSLETELDMDARDAGLIGAGSGQQQMFVDEDGNTVDAQGNPVEVDEQGNPMQQPVDKDGNPTEGDPDGEGGLGGKGEGETSPPAKGPQAQKKGKPGLDPGAEEDDGPAAGEAGNPFSPRNTPTPKVKNPKPATESFISQTMSEPMRDPKTDPKMKTPGVPNKPRTFLPTRGNGVVSPSGFDPKKDAGKKGSTMESGGESESQDAPAEKDKPEVKEKDRKDALAATARNRASVIIVRRGDQFLMGKRRDTGRWTLPGGMVEDNESMHQGGVRELLEETGMSAKRLKFLGSRLVEPEQGKSVQVSLYEHQADPKVRPHGKLDPDKELGEFRWLPIKGKLPEDVSGNLQHPNNVALAHLGLL